MRVFIGLAVAALTFSGTTAPAAAQPSFDCGRATTSTEIAICNSGQLSQLDRAISNAFFGQYNPMTGTRRKAFLSQQRAWLAQRDRCGPAHGCLAQEMQGRLAALTGATAAPQPARPQLTYNEGVAQLQTRLIELGFAAGVADGLAGPFTIEAATNYLRSQGQPITQGREIIEAYNRLVLQQPAPAAPSATTQIVPIAPPPAPAPVPAPAPARPTALDAATPLAPNTLQGEWHLTRAHHATSGLNYEIRRWMARAPTVLQSLTADRLRAASFKGQTLDYQRHFEVTPHEDGFELKAVRSPEDVGKFNLSRIHPLYSRSGVDVLHQKGGLGSRSFLIRFRQTPGAVAAGFGSLSMPRFCAGPAASLAKGAAKELRRAEEMIARNPLYAQGMDPLNAAILGFFADDGFYAQFGTRFEALDNGLRTEFVERLRTCALYHPERGSNDVIGQMLFGDRFTRGGQVGALGISRTSGKMLSLPLLKTAGHLHGALKRAKFERDKLAAMDLSGTISPEQARQILSITRSLKPSEVGGKIQQAIYAIENGKKQAQQAAQAEADRSKPALATDRLIRNAVRDYMAANCSQAALALRSMKAQGQGLLAIAISRVKPNRGACEVISPTHILRFNLGRVSAERCTGSEMAACSFTGFWSCSYKLNPAFGFSSGTANIDPICPVLAVAPVRFTGTFERNAPSRWTAKTLDWN
jgi:uncharacterized protein